MVNLYLGFTFLVTVLAIIVWFTDFAQLFLYSGGIMLVLFLISYGLNLDEKRIRKAHGLEQEKESIGWALGAWLFASLILTLFLFLGSR